MTIGERIKQRMIELGINQSQMAEMIGRSKSNVSNWLKDRHEPDMLVRPKIAEVLGVSVGWLEGRGITASADHLGSVARDSSGSAYSNEEKDRELLQWQRAELQARRTVNEIMGLINELDRATIGLELPEIREIIQRIREVHERR